MSTPVADRPYAVPAIRWRPALKRALAGKGAYVDFFDFSRAERIELVKEGVPARLLITLASDMHVTRERLFLWLGIARATANRKLRADELLSQDESERALGIARLVGQVDKIVAESGNRDGFDAAQWTAAWLDEPNRALRGKSPGDYMDTADGRALVSGLVAQMQSAAYA